MSAYLASRVNNLGREFLPSAFDEATERILNCGIVALDEVALHKLHGER